jgi:helix-turn-helix, Psq domain
MMRDCEIHGAACGAEEFPAGELAAAAAERFPIYEGLVMRSAVRIVCHRHWLSVAQLSRAADIPRNTLYRHLRGDPAVRMSACHALLVRLAIFEQERGRG